MTWRWCLPARPVGFIEELPGAAATKNQARAALKQFGDRLVQRHVIALNPFASVRSQKHHTDGKVPKITVQWARELLASIDLWTVVGLRGRAVLGTLLYISVRVGAVARMHCRDLQAQGAHQRVLRFLEKNGKDREIPVRHDLEEWLSAYTTSTGLTALSDMPLFPSALSGRPRRSAAAILEAVGRCPDLENAEAALGGGRTSSTAATALVPGAGGDQPAGAERPAGRWRVPGRALEPADDPALRPTSTTSHAQHRQADFSVMRKPAIALRCRKSYRGVDSLAAVRAVATA